MTAESLYWGEDGALTELGRACLDNVVKGGDAMQGARRRVPRLTAKQERDVMQGLQSALVLLAAMMEPEHENSNDL